MDTTVGQDMNCPTNIAMFFLVLFSKEKKISIFIGKWEFCIVLVKTSKESHFRTFPEKENLRKKYGAGSLIITVIIIIKSFCNTLSKKTASLLWCINIVIS